MHDRAIVKIAFLSLPITGHLNPMAALARKLQSLPAGNMDRPQPLSVNLHIASEALPTFLTQCVDGPIMSVENSLLMFGTLRNHQISTELHLFQKGGHGWSRGQPNSEVSAGPALFLTWIRRYVQWLVPARGLGHSRFRALR
jgi:hypothetical protein